MLKYGFLRFHPSNSQHSKRIREQPRNKDEARNALLQIIRVIPEKSLKKRGDPTYSTFAGPLNGTYGSDILMRIGGRFLFQKSLFPHPVVVVDFSYISAAMIVKKDHNHILRAEVFLELEHPSDRRPG